MDERSIELTGVRIYLYLEDDGQWHDVTNNVKPSDYSILTITAVDAAEDGEMLIQLAG